MTVNPIIDPDTIASKIKYDIEESSLRKGSRAMYFGASHTDLDRLQQSIIKNSNIDSAPSKPEHLNWNLRQRVKTAEIGPEFRFAPKLQAERILDGLKKNVGHEYQLADVVGSRKQGYRNDKAMSGYLKTGKCADFPGLNLDDFDDEADYN